MGNKKTRYNSFDNVLWIGGSPCSGKSSIAEKIVENHDFEYYKCDDFLDEYIKIGCKKNIAIMRKFNSMDLDQTWLIREIDEQVDDEIMFYMEAFEIIADEITEKYQNKKVIVEGTAILPHLIKSKNINLNKYICIVSTREFQIKEYSKREWVQRYLNGCSDPEQAFKNWMERDIQFANNIKKVALKENMNLIIEDGSEDIESRYRQVIKFWDM